MKIVQRMTSRMVAVVGMMGLLVAQSASALVTVDHVASTAGPVAVGQQFTVDVLITWDGSGSLQGAFSSTDWDSTQLELIDFDWLGIADFATSLFDVFPPPVFLPGLGRLGGANQPGDDVLSTIRSTQYGAAAPASASGAATDSLVTTLTFEVLAVGDGTAEIGNVILQGDAGAVGDTFAAGPDAVVTLPEPGSTVLGMAALASVFGVASIRRRS